MNDKAAAPPSLVVGGALANLPTFRLSDLLGSRKVGELAGG